MRTQKGLVRVLQERGLLPQDKALVKECKACSEDVVRGVEECCLVGILSSQPDFAAPVKSVVEEAVNAAGHLCLFLPKYHCELNPIEMVWGRAKQHQRNECWFTTVNQEQHVRRWLDLVSVEEMHFYRYMHFYRLGCNVTFAAYATRKYRGHASDGPF